MFFMYHVYYIFMQCLVWIKICVSENKIHFPIGSYLRLCPFMLAIMDFRYHTNKLKFCKGQCYDCSCAFLFQPIMQFLRIIFSRNYDKTLSGSGGHFEFDRQINRQSLFYTVVGESLFYTVVGDKCFFYTVVGDSVYFIQLWVTVFILYSCG